MIVWRAKSKPLRGVWSALVLGPILLGACTPHSIDPAGGLDDCWSCHGDRYQATTAPDHGSLGYPEDCKLCHDLTNWRPARVTAHEPGGIFPLTGAHANAACTDCHGDPLGDPPGPACVDCHQPDYQATANPDHQSLGLPSACDRCHNTAGWSPASFDGYHDFPLSTGRHAGLACSACHPAGSAWAEFTCLLCHEHERARMDDKHLGEVAGYQYDSAACYNCHPDGLVVEN